MEVSKDESGTATEKTAEPKAEAAAEHPPAEPKDE
jgi:hypothetical protein